MRNPIIAALDVPAAEAGLKLAKQLAPAVGAFKIGKELFVAAGPDIVRRIRDTGAAVFLDLKFHDIPNTVAKAVAAATRLDVQMLTIHTSGGREMMRAAEESAQQTAKQAGRAAPLVLGVTVLTSLDNAALDEIGFHAGHGPAGGTAGRFSGEGGFARAGLFAAGNRRLAENFARVRSTRGARHSHRRGKGRRPETHAQSA